MQTATKTSSRNKITGFILDHMLIVILLLLAVVTAIVEKPAQLTGPLSKYPRCAAAITPMTNQIRTISPPTLE